MRGEEARDQVKAALLDAAGMIGNSHTELSTGAEIQTGGGATN
jgi:hypothetical protein